MLFNENLIKAESDLRRASSDDLIHLCRRYLQVLTVYREDLSRLRGLHQTDLPPLFAAEPVVPEEIGRAVRAAFEITTRKRNETSRLLSSFTSISGHEAVRTFNQLKYRGFDNWRLKPHSVNSENDGWFEQIAMQEALETASRLRREAYISNKTLFFQSPEIDENGQESAGEKVNKTMNDQKIHDYKMRVADILKVFRHTYGLKADLVNVHSQTINTEPYKIMKIILEEQNIAIEIDDRVLVGKFMFVNRELSAADRL